LETSAQTVQKYAEDLSVLPPIEVNQDCELIDGWHRWTAHKKKGAETIDVVVTETVSDAELLELAIERNASHGLQLSQEDKRNMARRIYHATAERERDAKKAHLAQILSVSDRTVRGWLSRIDKDTKEARDRRIFQLWLAGWTQAEIAEETGAPRQTVTDVLSKYADFGNLSESGKAAATHATDFQVPIYNVWKQKEKTPGSSHFGNSEVTWLDRLLYLYTEPFDMVVDPFGGGGSTVDLCKKRLRRYWVSDRMVQPELEGRVRYHDLVVGGNVTLPKLPRWKDVKLVYLDPPYWKQAEGQYSNDAEDLANMAIDQFNDTLAGIIAGFARKLKNGEPRYIALIIQPTQWNAPKRQFTDHVGDMLRIVKLPVDMRFSVPYESQQYNAQMVDWAKATKTCLVLTREIVVWRVE
jgi:transposase